MGWWELPGASAMQWAAALPPENPVPGAHRGDISPSDISPDYCSPWFPQPRPNIIGVMCNSILSMPSCFDKAGGRLKIISYVKYDLLSMYSCIPGEYLLISSICSVQTFLKVPKCCLVAVPHFPKHLCHWTLLGHTHCHSVLQHTFFRKSFLCQVPVYTCGCKLERRVRRNFIHKYEARQI